MLIAVTLVAVIICADVVPAQEDVCYEGTDNAYAIRKLRATHITTAFYGGELSECKNTTTHTDGTPYWTEVQLRASAERHNVTYSAQAREWGLGCGFGHVSCRTNQHRLHSHLLRANELSSEEDESWIDCTPLCIDFSNPDIDPYRPTLVDCKDEELARFRSINGPGEWTGYDAELLDELSVLGRFSYEIVSMGYNHEISGSGKGYTALARQLFGGEYQTKATQESSRKVQLFGQSTWRASLSRLETEHWAWAVPMVSNDALFVTKETTNGKAGNPWTFLKPFDQSAWIAILTCTILYWLILWYVEVTDPDAAMTKDERELGAVELFYAACVSVTGEHQVDALSALMRVIQGGWLYLIFLLGAIYTANLTTILTSEAVTNFPLQSLTEVMERGSSFCLNEGSANWFYFNPVFNADFAGLNVVASKGTEGQIQNLIDGLCDATELTREDLYKWTSGKQEEGNRALQCSINVVGEPITKRSRGYMMESHQVCLQVGINALYQNLGAHSKQDAIALGEQYGYVTEPIEHALEYDVCGGGTLPYNASACGTFMDAHDLQDKFFNNPECSLLEMGATPRIQINAADLSGIFILYAGVVVLTVLLTCAGLDKWKVCQEPEESIADAMKERDEEIKDLENKLKHLRDGTTNKYAALGSVAVDDVVTAATAGSRWKRKSGIIGGDGIAYLDVESSSKTNESKPNETGDSVVVEQPQDTRMTVV